MWLYKAKLKRVVRQLDYVPEYSDGPGIMGRRRRPPLQELREPLSFRLMGQGGL